MSSICSLDFGRQQFRKMLMKGVDEADEGFCHKEVEARGT